MDAANTRQRQIIITSIALVGLIGLIIAGLWWSDPKRKVDAAQEKADAEAVSKQFATPAAVMGRQRCGSPVRKHNWPTCKSRMPSWPNRWPN
ncbi:MAG: hypothetical protein HZT40_11200 [Candidatus Thiothrix singaporensis]|uniref:Uncharacterized protein n=1 Tax=Candidatus Thiothrix singaporensis TaxID=2799669 RepID=A0A7L6ASD9_9GAMM|nr:MAG: hypothetical protein HZT40_11200 [Candidatus Thiothrix singaporensis]